MNLLQTFLFWTLNFDGSPFLSQLTKERVIYCKRKLCIVANECSFEIERFSIMRACEIKRVMANLYGPPCIYWSIGSNVNFSGLLYYVCLCNAVTQYM